MLITLAIVVVHTELHVVQISGGYPRLQKYYSPSQLVHVKKMCSNIGPFTPCACNPVLTTTEIYTGGQLVKVDFPEFKCEKKMNEKRKKEGRISPGYKCTQLISSRTLYEDERGRPIEAEIRYKAGCELRCINIHCKRRDITDESSEVSVGTVLE